MNEILEIYLYTSYQDNLSINKACLAFKDNKSCYLVFNYLGEPFETRPSA